MRIIKSLINFFLVFACAGIANAQTPEFFYNGAADVIMRFPLRGSGGRAIVHAEGNELTLNYGGDFSGGTRLGNAFLVANDGSFSANGKIRLLSNGYLGVGTNSPEVPLSVFGESNFFPVRSETGPGDVRMLSLGANFTNQPFISNNYPIVLKTGAGNQPLILNAARVGIGTLNPAEMLSVNGNVRAREIKVETSNWPDYVFEEDYKFLGLTELDRFIKINKHLPEMPSASEAETNGVQLGEMNKLLLKKVEELTLYIISQQKIIASQDNRLLKIENDLKK